MLKLDLFGFNVKVVFLVNNNMVLGYSWHYNEEKALENIYKIISYHGLDGKIVRSPRLEEWLQGKIIDTVLHGKKFSLPKHNYKNIRVYQHIINIPKGSIATYSEIAKISRIKYTEMMLTLLRNPFQILIPCHRLVTKKGKLFGFYPLGIEVKKKLLEIEGVETNW